MSKLLNFGTLLGGIGGVLAGAVAVLQFTSTPTMKIEALPELSASLFQLAQSISLDHEASGVAP